MPEMIWIYAVVGLLVGTIIGVIIGRLTIPNYQDQKSVKKELETTKFELEQQRQELIDHFAQTSEMLDTLGKDYTKLYQHMAKTSSELLPNLPEQDNPFDKQTAMSPEPSNPSEIEEVQPQIELAPKDYVASPSETSSDEEKSETKPSSDTVTAKAS